MDAGYALLVEEYVRAGVPLLEAIEQTSNMRARDLDAVDEDGKPVVSEEDIAVQNQSSMQQLQQMMGGL